MLPLDATNPLLSEIKASIDNIIRTDNQTIRTLGLTDALRHDILKALITYSEKVPHPASGATNVNGAISRRIERALGPLPMMISKAKSSIAEYKTSSTL